MHTEDAKTSPTSTVPGSGLEFRAPSTPTRVDRLPPAVTTNQSTYGLTEVALGGETYVCALDARSPRVRSKVSDVWAPGKSVCWSYAGTAAA